MRVERVGGGRPEPYDVVTMVVTGGGDDHIILRPASEFARRHYVGTGWQLVKMGLAQMARRRGA